MSSDQATEFPYPGLRPFRETESHLFFGREGQTDELLRRLQRRRFLAVLGTSGSGKSSLVNAGLRPALAGDYLIDARSRWRILVIRPGGDPLGRLLEKLSSLSSLSHCSRDDLRHSSMALVKLLERSIQSQQWDSDLNLLIIADQFEELFRSRVDESAAMWDERAMFVKLLIEAARAKNLPLYVVITMRSEYLGDCAEFRDLPETINDGQYLIPRLTREQWRAAIEGPARVMGAEIAPALLQRLLNDVTRVESEANVPGSSGDAADALPLLQHALNRTWSRFESCLAANSQTVRQMRLEHYEDKRVGGIDFALSRHLDEAFNDAKKEPDGERIAQCVFQRLRERDDKGREARAPIGFADLCKVVAAEPDQVRRVINCFREGDRTFLTPEPPAPIEESVEIDITHECLLRRWLQLTEQWIPEEEESRRIYLRLVQATEEKDPLAGTRLQTAKEWWDRRQPTAEWAARYDRRFADVTKFLKASLDEAEESARRRKEAEEKEQRKKARYKLAVGGLILAGGLALIALIVGVQLYRISEDATTAEAFATHNWRLAFAQLLAAKAQLAFSEAGTPRSTAALLAVASLEHSRKLNEPSPIESRSVLATAVPMMPEPLLPTLKASGTVTAMASSAGGTVLAVASENGAIQIVEAKSTRTLKGLEAPLGMTLTPDGQYLVVTGAEASPAVEIWDVSSGTRVSQLSCDSSPDGPAVLSPDHSLLLVPCGALTQWSERAWRAAKPGRGTRSAWARPLQSVSAIAFDDAGLRVAIAGEETPSTPDQILVYDLKQRKVLKMLRTIASNSGLKMITFLGAGIAVADDAGVLRIWGGYLIGQEGSRTVTQPPTVLALGRPILGLGPSADGQFLMTVTEDGTVRVLDSDAHVREQINMGAKATTATVDWSSRLVALANDTTDVSRWRIGDPGYRQPLPSTFSSRIYGIIFGAPTITVAADRVVVADNYRLRILEPDGTQTQRLLIALQSQNELGEMGYQSQNRLLAVSADGALLLVNQPGQIVAIRSPEKSAGGGLGSNPGDVVWRHQTQRVLRITSKLSTDSKMIAVIAPGAPKSSEQQMQLIDVATGNDVAAYPVKAELGFSADGIIRGSIPLQLSPDRHLLIRKRNGTIVDWDPVHDVTRELAKPERGAQVALSRSGALLAIAETQPTGDGATGTSIRLLTWPALAPIGAVRWSSQTGVSQLTFSNDELYLASASTDGGIRVWNPRTAEELGRIASSDPVSALAFSQDGHRIIAVGQSSVSRYLWMETDLSAAACRLVASNLTQREWDDYVPEKYREIGTVYRCVCRVACP